MLIDTQRDQFLAVTGPTAGGVIQKVPNNAIMIFTSLNEGAKVKL